MFRWFAQPMLRRNRARVYAGVRKHLRYLDANPDAPDRAERIAAMVASAEPLVRLLGQRIGRKGAGLAPLLEVLTRRYYGNRSLRDLRASEVAGCTFVVAEHRDETGRSAVLATAVDFPALPEAVRGRRRARRRRPRRRVADIYLTWADQPDDPDAMAAELREVLAAGQLPGHAPPDHHHRGRAQRRGDAPPLHLPAVAPPASPRSA